MFLTKFNPFNEMDNFFELPGFDFDDFFKGKENNRPLSVDVIKTKDSYKVIANVPGVSKDQIDISIDSGVLTIKGEIKKEIEDKDSTYCRKERLYGAFQRQIILPKDVDAEKIKSSYKDGVLELILPMGEKTKTKKIKVD